MEREKVYIVRNGEIEQVYQYRIFQHGFEVSIFCRGTESEVREYIEEEFPHDKSFHHAISEDEVIKIGELNIPVYIAPRKERANG